MALRLSAVLQWAGAGRNAGPCCPCPTAARRRPALPRSTSPATCCPATRTGRTASRWPWSGLSGAERWSHGRLRAAVTGTAAGLRAAGIGAGERVILRLGNTVEFPIAFLGAIAGDIVPVPTSSQLTGREVTAMAREIAPAAILGGGEGIALPDHPAPVIGEAALVAMRDLPPSNRCLGDPERPAFIVHTSGTSGQPRAVVHAHRAVWARRMMWEGWYGPRPRTGFCMRAPSTGPIRSGPGCSTPGPRGRRR
jgi:acyl-CoA synthetase (AMP-forming)/AMP-acid ligase II